MSYGPDAAAEWTIQPRRENLFARLAEVWAYRHLLGYFATKTLHSLYRKSSLGWIWLFMRITAPIGLNGVIFGGVLDQKSPDGTPYLLFFLCGQAIWVLFDRSLLYITRSMERNRKLLSKVYFPRLILPISAVSPSLLFLAIVTITLIGGDIYLRVKDGVWWIPLRPQLLVAPLAVILSLAFAIAVGFWTSVLQARYRDIRFGVRYSVHFLMFATSVNYSLAKLGSLKPLVAFMPIETPIELFRYATIGTPFELPTSVMVFHVAATLAIAVGGVWFFNREESASVDKL